MSAERSSTNTAAILLALLTFALFSLFTVFLRLTRQEISTVTVVWSRFSIGTIFLLTWCFYRKLPISVIPKLNKGPHLKQTLTGLIAFSCFAFSAPWLPISDFVALQFTIPLVLAVLSYFLLSEPIPMLRIVAIAFGMIGVVVVAQPSSQAGLLPVLVILFVCTMAAYRDIQLKRLTKTEPPELIAFYLFFANFILSSVILCLLSWWSGKPLLPFSAETLSSPRPLLLLIGLGVSSSSAQIMLGQTLKQLPANAIAPYAYTGLIWSMMFDYTIWGHSPDLAGVLGSFCIMADGFLAYLSLDQNRAEQFTEFVRSKRQLKRNR